MLGGVQASGGSPCDAAGVTFDCQTCGACCCNPDENRAERYVDYVEVTERHSLDWRVWPALRRLVLERRIPHRKVGSLLRFEFDEVDAWMDTLRRAPLQ